MEQTQLDKELEKVDKLYKLLAIERKEYTDRVNVLTKTAHSLSSISEGQVIMLSMRHEMTDKLMDMRKMKYRKNNTVQTMYVKLYHQYKVSGYKNRKVNRDETIEVINDELKPVYEQIEIMDTFMFFYQKIVEHLDKLGFVFKNKIEMERM
jgi:hypothetical protein